MQFDHAVFEEQKKGVCHVCVLLFKDLNCIELNQIRLDMYANG